MRATKGALPNHRGIHMTSIPATSTLPAGLARLLPTDTTILRNLILGGLAGHLLWEAFARFLTPWVLGYPLEPAGLIDALFNHLAGVQVNYWLREALHYVIGIIGYPVMYFIISRAAPKHFGLALDTITLVYFSVMAYVYFTVTKQTPEPKPLFFIFWTVVLMLVLSRFLNKNARVADSLSWGNFTWVNALGFMAPLAGLSPFLLGEGGELSYMSFIGHVIFGGVAAQVFEMLETRRTSPMPAAM